jgi:hypothetical protein
MFTDGSGTQDRSGQLKASCAVVTQCENWEAYIGQVVNGSY